MSVKEAIKKQRETNENSFDKIEIILGGTLYEVLVRKLTGVEMVEITGLARCAPNPDSLREVGLGYSPDKVALEAVKRGGELLLNGEKQDMDAETWEDVFAVIDGEYVQAISAVVWADHFYNPLREVEEAKKALATHSASGGSKN